MRTDQQCQQLIDTWQEAGILDAMTEVVRIAREIELGNPVNLDHLPQNLQEQIEVECLKQFGRPHNSGFA
jgi:hypothetical protein